MTQQSVEAFVAASPGALVTSIILRVAVRNASATTVKPRITSGGTRVPLPGGIFEGSGEIVVQSQGDGSRVLLQGTPPVWPLSIRWAKRTLAQLLSGQVYSYAVGTAPASDRSRNLRSRGGPRSEG